MRGNEAFFDQWIKRGHPHLGSEDYEAIFNQAPLLSRQGKTVLDIGCGDGRVAGLLKSRGHRVIGVDMSSEAIAEAVGSGALDQGLVAEIGRQRLNLPDHSIDVALCFNVLLYVFDLREVFQELYRVLKPGGELLIVDHHHRNPYAWLHFHRPDCIDRLLEGQSNVPRRLLTEPRLAEAGRSLFDFDRVSYFSLFTTHPNALINGIHRVARVAFRQLRTLTQSPWTANCVVIVGQRAGAG